MAFFATMPAGSGVLTPVFPDLKFRWSTDGLGEVYEDLNDGFLVVWNSDMVDRQVEYSPGLFTPMLVAHTGHVVSWGSDTPNLIAFPFALAADFERDRHPISIIDWPVNYNRWQYDTAYNTHTTGDARRSITWPPLRALYHSTDANLRASAWASMRSWCTDQLCRPLSSCAGPFTPPQDVDTCGNSWEWNHNLPREWGYDSQVTRPDQLGTPRSWNSFDPAHNETGPQFAFAAAGGRLGVVLIWMLFRWTVQGASPISRCFNSSYSVPFDQERSIKWLLDLCTRAFMVGLEWADPNLIRDWCGGLDGKNGGLGFKPRESLRAYFDRLAGPDYGGTGGASARRHWQKTNNFALDAHYQPYLGSTRQVCGGQGQCNTNFQFNGKSYGRLFDAEKGFHRYMLMQAVPEVVRAHDFLLALDASDPLLDPARVSEIRRFAADFTAFVAETGMHGSWSAARGRFRQYFGIFALGAAEKGFETFDALDQAIRDAIACNPVDCDGSGNNWVYPGTDPFKRWHLFAVQHARWEPGAGLWYLSVGVFTESEAKETGPPGYASAFGYDADLQAIIDINGIEQGGSSYYGKGSTASHFDIVWRAVEKSSTTVLPVTGPAKRRRTTSVPGVISLGPPPGPTGSARIPVVGPVRVRRTSRPTLVSSGTSIVRVASTPRRRRRTRSDLLKVNSIGGTPPAAPRAPAPKLERSHLDVGISAVADGNGVDFELEAGDLALESGLQTAVLISLFSDARALSFEQLADRSADPRGWWADRRGAPIGSRLWTATERARLGAGSLREVEDLAREALAWLLREKVARTLKVSATVGNAHTLLLDIEVKRGRAGRWQGLWDGLREAQVGEVTVRLLTR